MAERTSLVSADRQTSLFSNLTIGDNMVVRLHREIARAGGALRFGRMLAIAHELRDRFRVKADSVHLPIRSLSGGNQQKVAIAAAIVRRPEVLVLEEPTRGVDIGSKREIYRLMREYASQGHAVIIYCTEVPEVFEAADLAYVVSDGRLSAPLMVMNHPDVEDLARAVTRLERHGAGPRPDARRGDRLTRPPVAWRPSQAGPAAAGRAGPYLPSTRYLAMNVSSRTQPRPGASGSGNSPSTSVGPVLDHVPEDRVAGRGERLDVGAVRLRGQQVRGDLGLLVVAELDVEGRGQGGDPSPLGRAAAPRRVVVADIDGPGGHHLAHPDPADLALAGGHVDVAAHAHVAQTAEVGVPAGRLLEPADGDALGPHGGHELEGLGHGIALVGIDHEQEVVAGMAAGPGQAGGIDRRRLGPDLELHADHAVLGLEEVDLALDLLALGALVVGDVVAADADHRDAVPVAAPDAPQRLAHGLAHGVPDGACRCRPSPAWRTSAAGAGRRSPAASPPRPARCRRRPGR